MTEMVVAQAFMVLVNYPRGSAAKPHLPDVGDAMSVSERRDPLHRLDATLRGCIRLADRLSERVRRVRRCQSASDGGRGPAGGRVAAEGRRGRGGKAMTDHSQTR